MAWRGTRESLKRKMCHPASERGVPTLLALPSMPTKYCGAAVAAASTVAGRSRLPSSPRPPPPPCSITVLLNDQDRHPVLPACVCVLALVERASVVHALRHASAWGGGLGWCPLAAASRQIPTACRSFSSLCTSPGPHPTPHHTHHTPTSTGATRPIAPIRPSSAAGSFALTHPASPTPTPTAPQSS